MSVMIFFHVLAMFIAFGLTAGTGIFSTILAMSADPNIIRVAMGISRRLNMIGGISMLIGILIGFGMASEMGISLGSTWLVVTYICIVLMFVLLGGVLGPWAARVEAAVKAAGSQSTPELVAAVNNPGGRIAGPLVGVLWIIIIAMMALRP